MRRRRHWVSILVAIWLVAACSSQPSTPASGSPRAFSPSAPVPMLAGQPMTACVIAGEIPVKAEVPGYCGTLHVPEDRSNPAGRHIGLHVAVVPAAAGPAKPDPFFAVAGGPGDVSSQFFAWLPAHYAAVHANRAIVLVDQRGTGASNVLTLPPPPDTSTLSPAQADERMSAWARDGLAALGTDPRFYTSTVAADDLDDVRAALGYDKIDLYGTSYGGTLVQYYLRQHPEHVRAAILDGATPLDVPVMERIAANSQHALDLLLSRCAKDAACNEAFPKLASEWSSLFEGLKTGITTTVTNPDTGQAGVATLDVVGPSLHSALLTGSAAAQVPLAIHLASENRWDQTAPLVPPVSSGGPVSVMAQEIMCSEAWARFDPNEVARTGAGSYALPMQLARARAQASLCRYLPKGVVPADDAAAVRTDLPVLWLTGDGDPQDPPANLTGVPSQQPNSGIVVMPAQEHVVGHLGCGPSVIAAFLDAGTATGLDVSCIAKGDDPAPTFHLP